MRQYDEDGYEFDAATLRERELSLLRDENSLVKLSLRRDSQDNHMLAASFTPSPLASNEYRGWKEYCRVDD